MSKLTVQFEATGGTLVVYRQAGTIVMELHDDLDGYAMVHFTQEQWADLHEFFAFPEVRADFGPRHAVELFESPHDDESPDDSEIQ